MEREEALQMRGSGSEKKGIRRLKTKSRKRGE